MRQLISPKADFQKDKARAEAMAEAVAAPSFREASKCALLEYTLAVTTREQPAIAGLHIQGATQFLDVLLNIGEPSVPLTPMPSEELDNPEEALKRAMKR